MLRQIRERLSAFAGDNRGNIAMIFALALLPFLTFIGAAIDYSRVNAARSAMQAALDSTALMISKDFNTGIVPADQITTKANTYFNALYKNSSATVTSFNATYTAASSQGASSVVVTGSGYVTTDFMKVAGFPQIDFNTSATTTWGNTRLRVAMALDNTGSMASNGKIGALQTASKNLIDQLAALAKTPGDVYVSIIPFAKVVNLADKSDQTWIDWSDWENPPTAQSAVTVNLPNNWSSIGPGSTCPFTTGSSGFVCTSSPVNASSNAATIPTTGAYAGYICPGLDANSHSLYNGCWNSVATGATVQLCTGSTCNCTGANNTCACTGGNGNNKVCRQSTFNHTWIKNARSTWTGCIADRTQPYDTQNTTPTTSITSSLFPANQYYENSEAYCKTGNSPPLQPIVPLSYNWTALKSAIDGMTPTGGTNQPIGLAWAWQSLAQSDPLNAPAEDPNYTYNKVIILLSDGLNTENRWPVNGNGVTQNTDASGNGLIDIRQKAQCDNIKKDKNVTIYTIQVNTSSPPDPTSSVLQYCASSPSNFYLLTSASQTIAAFSSIGAQLSKLRVAR